jgi:hypothetical protein
MSMEIACLAYSGRSEYGKVPAQNYRSTDEGRGSVCCYPEDRLRSARGTHSLTQKQATAVIAGLAQARGGVAHAV